MVPVSTPLRTRASMRPVAGEKITVPESLPTSRWAVRTGWFATGPPEASVSACCMMITRARVPATTVSRRTV